MIFPLSTKKTLIILVVVLGVVALSVGLFFAFRPAEPNVHVGAVVANGHECAAIGLDILKQNGSAADAAIATLFCEGVSCPQSMGLGGGFLLTIYTKATGKAESLVAREVAPKAATEDMYVNDDAVTGPKSIAVPGELIGYWELHQKYGKLKWDKLIEPTIELCRRGHVVTGYLGRILKTREDLIKQTESLAEIFINPATKEVWEIGDVIKRVKLADTLETIAKEGADTMYKNGTIAQKLVNEMQSLGALLTIEDLMEYKVRWQEPEISELIDNQTMFTSPLPGSGVLITFMMNILNGFLPDNSPTSFHRIAETMKFAYAKRTDLGDMQFVPNMTALVDEIVDPKFAAEIRKKIEDDQTHNDYKYYGATYSINDDHGTAHINVLAPNGDAVSVTSTINNIFGSKVRSMTTGILMNDEMDDFSTPGKTNAYGVPASPSNYIKPGKMPLSSMCPLIVVDKNGDVTLIIGGAGGSKITSSVAYTIARHLYLKESLADAVNARRIHHQLLPMQIEYENGLDPKILSALSDKGHIMFEGPSDSGFASLTAIARHGSEIHAVYDDRRQGSSAVY